MFDSLRRILFDSTDWTACTRKHVWAVQFMYSVSNLSACTATSRLQYEVSSRRLHITCLYAIGNWVLVAMTQTWVTQSVPSSFSLLLGVFWISSEASRYRAWMAWPSVCCPVLDWQRNLAKMVWLHRSAGQCLEDWTSNLSPILTNCFNDSHW